MTLSEVLCQQNRVEGPASFLSRSLMVNQKDGVPASAGSVQPAHAGWSSFGLWQTMYRLAPYPTWCGGHGARLVRGRQATLRCSGVRATVRSHIRRTCDAKVLSLTED